jgi:hypothetical protein
MKLGSQTGSVTNHLYSRAVIGQPVPTVGMGATILGWTDRHAGTIVEVIKGGKYIAVTRDRAKRIDKNGMSEMQEYAYTSDPDGAKHWFKQEKDGRWSSVTQNSETGRFKKDQSEGLRIGVRDSYYDYSF